MNFLSAEVSNHQVFWHRHLLPVTAAISNGPVTVGVRPEDISMCAETSEAEPWSGRVSMIDFLGHENIVHVDVAGQSFVIRSGREVAAQPGQLVRLGFPPKRLHLFAVDGGELRLN